MTTDELLGTGSTVVLVTQIVLPLVIGAPALRVMMTTTTARKPDADADANATSATAATTEAASVAPLRCPSCDAPVPLAAADFACPFCRAAIHPPDAYQRLLALRVQAREELARAERLWRFSRISTAWPILWLLRIAIVAWGLAVLFAVAVKSDEWPRMLLWLPAIVMLLQALVGLVGLSGQRDARKLLPPVPKRSAFAIDAGTGSCPECGAPVHFDEGRLATTCGYCGSDAYRAALAEAARSDAAASESSSRKRLRAAVDEIRSNRHEIAGYLGFVAFADIFYMVVFAVMSLGDYIFG